jgi:hypothetical protein
MAERATQRARGAFGVVQLVLFAFSSRRSPTTVRHDNVMGGNRASSAFDDEAADATLVDSRSVFVLGVAVNLYFGRRGFARSSGIAFDGGWRMLNGQMPFRDFCAKQHRARRHAAPFFTLFGVTWFALCLHASVINGLLCVAVMGSSGCCRRRWEATAFAALSAFFFYPPTGTPFNDQPRFSSRRCSCRVVAGQRSFLAGAPGWFAVPPLFLLGLLLSIQRPSARCAWRHGRLDPRRALS